MKLRSGSVALLLGRLSFNLELKLKTFQWVYKSLAGLSLVILKEDFILDTQVKGELRFPQSFLLYLSTVEF